MSAEVIQLGNGQFVAVSPISPYDANRMDANEEDDALSVSTTSTRERRHSFTVNSSINDNVLATSVQLFPPREHLLREGGSSPSRSNSRTSSPTDRRGLSASPQRGCRPSESLKTVEIGNLTLAETSFTDLKSPAPSTTSSRAPSSTSKVSQRRGTLLGPFMFMTKDTDKKLLERFSARDIKTMIKQLQLLEIQVKERHERDRLGLEEKVCPVAPPSLSSCIKIGRAHV